MIQLPKNQRDPKETEKLCLCRPICKSRRRVWNGETLNTSAELLLERKPTAECFRRAPKKVYPNSPCPLFGRTGRVTVKEKNASQRDVVRICQAPVDDHVDTPYLRYAEIARKLGKDIIPISLSILGRTKTSPVALDGAWEAVMARCAFCACGACPCSTRGYAPRDAERAALRRDMRRFDARVKRDCADMKIMYL